MRMFVTRRAFTIRSAGVPGIAGRLLGAYCARSARGHEGSFAGLGGCARCRHRRPGRMASARDRFCAEQMSTRSVSWRSGISVRMRAAANCHGRGIAALQLSMVVCGGVVFEALRECVALMFTVDQPSSCCCGRQFFACRTAGRRRCLARRIFYGEEHRQIAATAAKFCQGRDYAATGRCRGEGTWRGAWAA